tara:strand:- start:14 stop:1216 length:1203 start_codon:yes stop_codon:yes gene_type:complete
LKLEKQKKNILYLSYDGLMEPLGDSQILSYLKNISKEYKINLITFEKKNDLKNIKKLSFYKKEANKYNINWIYYKYSNYPKYISTFINISLGSFSCLNLFVLKKIQIVHIRSYIPGFMVFIYFYLFKFKFIFDMRGFLPEEKIDRNNWSTNSLTYKFFKYFEKKLIKKSDKIVVLTYCGKKILQEKFNIDENNIFVIPTCVDTNIYLKKRNIYKKNISNFTMAFVGSLNRAYNFDKMISLFKRILLIDNNLKILFYCKDEYKNLYNKFISQGVSDNNFEIKFLNKKNLIKEMKNIDIGYFYLNKNYSINASFPTKIGEFFSTGTPILCNNFNDDISEIIKDNKIGLVFNDFDDEKKIYSSLISILKDKFIINRCNEYAINNLSVNAGSKKYLNIYNNLIY